MNVRSPRKTRAMWPPSSGTTATISAQKIAICRKPWTIGGSEPLAAQERVDEVDADQRADYEADGVRGVHTRSIASMRSTRTANTPTARTMAMMSMASWWGGDLKAPWRKRAAVYRCCEEDRPSAPGVGLAAGRPARVRRGGLRPPRDRRLPARVRRRPGDHRSPHA